MIDDALTREPTGNELMCSCAGWWNQIYQFNNFRVQINPHMLEQNSNPRRDMPVFVGFALDRAEGEWMVNGLKFFSLSNLRTGS